MKFPTIDFSYNIHTQIGNTSIGAKVNHNLVPLNYKLKSGDQIEIITSKIQKPKEEWLKLVVTARAKSRIKQAIRDDRKSYKNKGTEKLKYFFEQANIEYTRHNVQQLQDGLLF